MWLSEYLWYYRALLRTPKLKRLFNISYNAWSFLMQNMERDGKLIDIQFVEQPKAKGGPFCVYDIATRQVAQATQAAVQREQTPAEGEDADTYKRLLMSLGVPPVDIVKCVKNFKSSRLPQTARES